MLVWSLGNISKAQKFQRENSFTVIWIPVVTQGPIWEQDSILLGVVHRVSLRQYMIQTDKAVKEWEKRNVIPVLPMGK